MKRINLPRHGQHEGREDRNRKYTEFTGAKLVNLFGEVVGEQDDVDAEVTKEASKHLKTIRESLTLGVDNVVCSVVDPRVYDLIRGALKPKELNHVHFAYFDVPRPAATVRVT